MPGRRHRQRLRRQSAARPSNGSFGAVQPISPPGDSIVPAKVAIDRAGVATAVFAPFASNAQILLTRRDAGGTFGGVQPISPAGGSSFFPAVSVDDEGNVLAGWTFTSAGAGNPQVAQVAAYDAGPPSLAAVSVPGTAEVGQGVGMAAAATDRWSPVSLKWSFGDGASAVGPAVTHTFGASGAFDVSATATDAVGNASSATRPILVGAAARQRRKTIRSRVLVTWGVSGKDVYLLRLKIKAVPKRGKAQLRCKGDGCPSGASRRRSGEAGDHALQGDRGREGRRQAAAELPRRTAARGADHRAGLHRQGGALQAQGRQDPERPTLCIPRGATRPRRKC